MANWLLTVLDWSEVWALLIPLLVWLFHRRQPVSLKPVVVYLWLALLINAVIDVIMTINIASNSTTLSNNPWYNLHSLARFTCFSIYFIQLTRPYFTRLKWALAIFSIGFTIINFVWVDDFFNHDVFSSNLFVAEAYLLLIYCMQYYLAELKRDDDAIFQGPDFWIVTGLAMYVVVNFFVFLFYLPMLRIDMPLATNIWYVHNVAFIILCICIAKAFYGTIRHQYTG